MILLKYGDAQRHRRIKDNLVMSLLIKMLSTIPISWFVEYHLGNPGALLKITTHLTSDIKKQLRVHQSIDSDLPTQSLIEEKHHKDHKDRKSRKCMPSITNCHRPKMKG